MSENVHNTAKNGIYPATSGRLRSMSIGAATKAMGLNPQVGLVDNVDTLSSS